MPDEKSLIVPPEMLPLKLQSRIVPKSHCVGGILEVIAVSLEISIWS